MNKFLYVNVCCVRKYLQTKRRAAHIARFFVVFACLLPVSFAFAVEGGALDSRLTKLERMLDNQNFAQILQSLQALQQEVSELRGDVEVLSFELDKLKKQQKDIYLDLDQRIQQTDKAISNLGSVSPVTGGEGGAAGEAEVLVDDAEAQEEALSEQASYQAALTLLKSGRYKDAIQSYQLFLINYPESTFAPNAQYWMAEAYYVLKDFQSAAVQFQKVISAYPNSRKVADAHLKLGFAYYELKEWAKAREALETVIVEYSSSTAARLAQRRIQKMKLEGNL